ncbi:MAG: hypothetical protein DMF63_10060 [Acidobacteria bacterium]|nr:MAG: hypothetical protein DMF63_10060 [Acidobacteriota bacterium]
MKIIRMLLLAIAAISLFSIAAGAQTKKKPVKAKSTASKTPTIPPLDVRAARAKVDELLGLVTRFATNLEAGAKSIEDIDNEAKLNRVRKQSLDQNAKDKNTVINAIRNLREGMVKLETEFRTKPALKKYLPTIQGISDLAGQAETSAVGGKFVAANAPIQSIQQKLTNTLAAMPNVPI